jgi:transcriptional regulator
MYISRLNLMTDVAEAVAFMQQYSFATIITATDNLPVATHLPFVVTQRNGTVTIAFCQSQRTMDAPAKDHSRVERQR